MWKDLITAKETNKGHSATALCIAAVIIGIVAALLMSACNIDNDVSEPGVQTEIPGSTDAPSGSASSPPDGERKTGSIAASGNFTMALKGDGTVLVTGIAGRPIYTLSGQIVHYSELRNVKSIAAFGNTLALLHNNGEMSTTLEIGDLDRFRGITGIAAGENHLIALRADGTVIASAVWDTYGETDVGSWSGIVAVRAGEYWSAGLKSDGTVVTAGKTDGFASGSPDWTDIPTTSPDAGMTAEIGADGSIILSGEHAYAQYDPNVLGERAVDVVVTEYFAAWLNADGTIGVTGQGFYFDLRVFGQVLRAAGMADITAIAAGGGFASALTAGGNVQVWGDNSAGQWGANAWTLITAIAAGENFLLGLQSDGSVISTGAGASVPIDVSEWEDIIAIAAGADFAVGVRSDGTVVSTGSDPSGRLDVDSWSGIIAVEAGASHAVGLKADGTCVAAGANFYGECDLSTWTDIIKIAASDYLTIGLRRDGTVLIAGDLGFGGNEIDVSSWTDIVDVAVGNQHAVGLKSDGTLVAAGSNSFGQTAVGGWTLW